MRERARLMNPSGPPTVRRVGAMPRPGENQRRDVACSLTTCSATGERAHRRSVRDLPASWTWEPEMPVSRTPLRAGRISSATFFPATVGKVERGKRKHMNSPLSSLAVRKKKGRDEPNLRPSKPGKKQRRRPCPLHLPKPPQSNLLDRRSQEWRIALGWPELHPELALPPPPGLSRSNPRGRRRRRLSGLESQSMPHLPLGTSRPVPVPTPSRAVRPPYGRPLPEELELFPRCRHLGLPGKAPVVPILLREKKLLPLDEPGEVLDA